LPTFVVSSKNIQPWERGFEATAYRDIDGVIIGPLRPYFSEAADREAQQRKNFSVAPESLEGFLNRRFATTVAATEFEAGEFYPRVWRGPPVVPEKAYSLPPVDHTGYVANLISGIEHLEALYDDLSAIFRVANPDAENYDVFGAEIRNLLILACTEVEAHWKGVLKANRYSVTDDRYSTNDYVKLLPLMRLDRYSFMLLRYPSVLATPFKDWDKTAPTASLKWYDAYNKVKHDREGNFKYATLRHAMHAVGACFIMLAAQYGTETLAHYDLRSTMLFGSTPTWEPQYWSYGPIPRRNWQKSVPEHCLVMTSMALLTAAPATPRLSARACV
jgi:hypothetical protein